MRIQIIPTYLIWFLYLLSIFYSVVPSWHPFYWFKNKFFSWRIFHILGLASYFFMLSFYLCLSFMYIIKPGSYRQMILLFFSILFNLKGEQEESMRILSPHRQWEKHISFDPNFLYLFYIWILWLLCWFMSLPRYRGLSWYRDPPISCICTYAEQHVGCDKIHSISCTEKMYMESSGTIPKMCQVHKC